MSDNTQNSNKYRMLAESVPVMLLWGALFPVVFGALLLGENIFKLTHLFALLFILAVILLSGMRKKTDQ